MLEKTIQSKILRWLRTQPDLVAFKVAQGAYSERGVSDIICCVRGRFVALEVKTQTGKLTKHQERFLERVNNANGVGVVVRSLDDAKKIIEEVRNGGCIQDENQP